MLHREMEQKGHSRELEGLIYQLLFNHWNAVSFPQKFSIIVNRQDYFNYSVFQKYLKYTRGMCMIWHKWKLKGTNLQSHIPFPKGTANTHSHTELRANSTDFSNNKVLSTLRLKNREKNTHLSARTYGWDVCQVRGRNFITEIKRPKLWISCFWYSPWTIPDK